MSSKIRFLSRLKELVLNPDRFLARRDVRAERLRLFDELYTTLAKVKLFNRIPDPASITVNDKVYHYGMNY